MRIGSTYFIRLSPEQVVVKRGRSELLIEGESAGECVEKLVGLLTEGVRDRRQLVGGFPTYTREAVSHLVDRLAAQGFLSASFESEEWQLGGGTGSGDELSNFWSNFTHVSEDGKRRLKEARVLLVGQTRIAEAIKDFLGHFEVAEVRILPHPVLDTPYCPPRSSVTPTYDSSLLEQQLGAGYTLVCATSEIGEADALLEINRGTITHGLPYLPIWTSDLLGYIGPLHYPKDGPCFQCFRFRRDANEYKPDVARVVRSFVVSQREAQIATLPGPMLHILGSIGAVDILKLIAGVAPADSINSLVRLNLISFGLTVHRLLKIPRCPVCSDMSTMSPKTITRRSPFLVGRDGQ